MKRSLYISLTSLFCVVFLSAQESRQNNFKIKGNAQGTSYQISYYSSEDRLDKKQIDSIFMLIDRSMSIYQENSSISQINRSPKGGQLDFHFSEVMKKAALINRDTEGVFDVTVEPLIAAWGFSAKTTDSLPTKEEIEELLPLVGMDNIKLKGRRLTKKHAGVKINVNGIAQGYTVDVLADFVRKQGISDFFIELGGEIKAEGRKRDGSFFSIGVEGPMSKSGDIVGIKHVVSLHNKALTTSGGYNQFIQKDDKRYIHIINPKTGYPIDSDILSVTVLADDAITADGYDNAIMAMGVNKAIEFLDDRSWMDAYIVYQDSKGIIRDTMTNGFKTIIKN